MENRGHWDTYFKEHKYPCFITHICTQEILYFNNEFKKLMDIDERILGTAFYDLVNKENIQLSKPEPNWDLVDYYEVESYNSKMDRRYKLKSTKMQEGQFVFCEMIPLQNSEHDNVAFEKAVAECMEVLEGPEHKVLQNMMKHLTKFYECGRAYIYRFDVDCNTINCMAQWCETESTRVTQEIGTKMDAKLFMDWLKGAGETGIVSGSVNGRLEKDDIAKEVLETFGMENLTVCNVMDANHEIVGLVGISNREDESKELDRRLLQTVAKLVAQDVSKEKLESDLREQHYRDDLTGLYNRSGYSKKMDKIMREAPKSMGVISVNVNGLRHINENVGIEHGDHHIKKSATRLVNHFGFEFFRMSGDEFVGIAPNISEDDFEEKAMCLYAAMRQEKNYDFSVGHAWSGNSINAMTLIHEADMLMYINKQQYYAEGKKTFDEMKNTVLAELLDHLKHDEFMIYLQPQVWLKDGTLYGAEALIRMFDKKLQKMVFPDQFIPLYEENSVIRHLDMFVLEEVCKLQKEWVAQGKSIPISVNFSRVTLHEVGIVDVIASVCEKYDVPNELIVIEITERVGLINNNVASMLVQQFKDKGFHLSLDDFGCAYSNIITLAQIEVDEVKIDKSLVDFIMTNRKNRILVKSILTMCNELEGTATLAEGIEDKEQGDLLHELGCGLGQGYHYSRPIPVDEFVTKYINI